MRPPVEWPTRMYGPRIPDWVRRPARSATADLASAVRGGAGAVTGTIVDDHRRGLGQLWRDPVECLHPLAEAGDQDERRSARAEHAVGKLTITDTGEAQVAGCRRQGASGNHETAKKQSEDGKTGP